MKGLRTVSYREFELVNFFIHDRIIPIASFNSKLVKYPSRFILFSIQQKIFSLRTAKKKLKVIVKFIDFLNRCLPGTVATPDDLIVDATSENIRLFLLTQNRACRKDVQKLLLDFFIWLEKEEKISKVSIQIDFLKQLTIN
jgi:hypothetical protein